MKDAIYNIGTLVPDTIKDGRGRNINTKQIAEIPMVFFFEAAGYFFVQ